MAIKEQNRMAISTKVVPAPQRTVNLYPVKDAYVSLENPVFPFGRYNTLTIQNSETKANKALMAFDIPEIDPVDFGNLAKVTLTLYPMYSHNRDVHLILKYHQDDGWPENDITWMGCPVEYPEIVARATLLAGEQQVSFDLLNIFKQNGIDYNHYAFTIIEDPEYGEQDTPLDIGSRESIGTSRAPKLSYTYNYYPENFDVAELDVKFAVRRWKESDLATHLKVKNGYKSSDLTTKMHVVGHTGDDVYYNITMLPSPRAHATNYRLNLKVRQFGNKVLPVKQHVKGYRIDTELPLNNFAVNLYGGDLDYNVNSHIRGRQDYNIRLHVNLHQIDDYLDTQFAVQKNVRGYKAPSIPVSMHVERHDEISYLDTTFAPRYWRKSDNYNITLRVKSEHRDADLVHVHTVRPNGELLMPVKMHVIGYEDKLEYDMIFRVRGSASLPVYMTTLLHGEAEPYNINMKINASWRSDIITSFKVEEPKWKSYAFIM